MNRIYILLSVLSLVFVGCTEKLDTDYQGETDNLLVVVGELSTDTTSHKVFLSRTVNYNADTAEAERGATVTITDIVSNRVFELNEIAPGVYSTQPDVFGVVEHEYRLDIQTSNGEDYFAVSKINSVTDIDSISVKFAYESFIGEYFYKVYFFGQEPAGKGDYYKWDLYMNDTLYSDTLSKSQFQSDDFVDGQYISDFDIYWLEPKEVKGDTVLFTVEMGSLTEDYYNYLIEVMSETAWRGGPFDPTPANVSTNIEGGLARGFFKTTKKKSMSIIHIKSEEEILHENDGDYGF